jgi:hypothetical protein
MPSETERAASIDQSTTRRPASCSYCFGVAWPNRLLLPAATMTVQTDSRRLSDELGVS